MTILITVLYYTNMCICTYIYIYRERERYICMARPGCEWRSRGRPAWSDHYRHDDCY